MTTYHQIRQEGINLGIEKGIEKGIEIMLLNSDKTVQEIAKLYEVPIQKVLAIKQRLESSK